MSDIKFRAWDGKKMLFMHNNDFHLECGGVYETNMYAEGMFREWPLMQYIGRADENKVEIYYGDIVVDRHNPGETVVDERMVALWKASEDSLDFNFSDLRVVSHIHS